jgi:hypothetical protein
MYSTIKEQSYVTVNVNVNVHKINVYTKFTHISIL